MSTIIKEELETERHVLKSTLDEFEVDDDSGRDRDELLEILSVKCQIQNLSLSQLTADDLGRILSALDTLLFDEWISAPPSLSTLQHTQVFITELCVLSLNTLEGVSLQSVSKQVQYLVDSISQSACNVPESFLLSQALYLTLMHFFKGYADCDVVLMARRWAEEELPFVNVVIIEFLSSLISSLQKTVERASVFILKMEIQSLKHLLSTLTNINDTETHSKSTELILRLVQTNQWTPMEAVTLLTALSQRYAEDSLICKVLVLIQVFELPPDWTDESGHSLINALDSADPDRFQVDFEKTLRKTDEISLSAALADLKMLWSLDDSVTDMIKNITTGVLHCSENALRDGPSIKDSFKGVTFDAGDLQNSLSQLCKAVYDTKGWRPTVRMMLRWCALVLTEKSAALDPVAVESDTCVTAMFAATQVLMGNKVNIVLSSDGHPEETAEEWSDFYEYLGMSVDTNMKESKVSGRNVYEVDIVYGKMDAFLSDYFQQGMELMEKGSPQQSREFIFEGLSLKLSTNLELSRFKDPDSGVLAAKILQSLMGKFHSEDKEMRHSFIKTIFQVLHSNLIKDTTSVSKIISVSQKVTGEEVPPTEVFILTFLENLLREVTKQTDAEINKDSPAGNQCLEVLLTCVTQCNSSTTLKEVIQMVSALHAQRLWSAAESLNLLAALIDHHHDDDCTNIMKILHLMSTYQISSQWTNENDQCLLKLVDTYRTEDLIKHLEKRLRDEEVKSIDTLFDELRHMKDVDEPTLSKSYKVVTHVRNLINTGDIKNHTDVQRARSLSHNREPEHLQEILAVLCNAVHNTAGGWWPRDTQIISWCLLALSNTGRLLEMGTGEGKSCVIAMFAALRVLQGEKVDVVSSSSVLCERDAKEWENFYKYFDMTADSNTKQTKDEERKECYQKDVVYGTIEAFAADHLRQIFEMKDVRPLRKYECIIIDEVDSLLLDQGVQLTYLSSPMVSMQHFNSILAMISVHVSQYGFLSAGHQTFLRSPPASFFKAIFDSIDTEGTEIEDPMDILQIAEETQTVEKGFTEAIYQTKKEELLQKLKTVRQDAMVDFFQEIENYVPYGFTVYTLDNQGSLILRKRSPYNKQDIPELSFLVLDEGLCCILYDSEEDLIKAIAEIILQKLQYTPCENNAEKVNIPGFLKNLIEKKVCVWVQNAFLAIQLREGREYVIHEDNVCPVDFRSTGIVELNKKWGDGLQQFVEIKHKVKLNTMSIVTNYVSNISFFEMYNGKIYGTTGTLGSTADIQFLQELYPNLAACKMPTFNRRKLFELGGTLTTSAEEWKSEIKRVVMDQISTNSYRKGRAALVICETINKAKEIYDVFQSIIPDKTILYCRSDTNSLSRISTELLPGHVVVATNLAGRGTDIKVSKTVNNNGGLFVVLSFLSENTRVELQAFGRTARKGKPGSAQIIMSNEHLQQSFRTASTLEEAKDTRDRLSAEKTEHLMKDIEELRLREELFSDYCETLQEIHENTDAEEKMAVVAIMNEFWGMWLQMKSEEIDQFKTRELKESLKADLSLAKSQCRSQTSPSLSIYHYIKFANVALSKKQWAVSSRLFETAMKQDGSWAAIAFYSHAYCTIMQKKEGYLTKARDDLMKALESLTYFTEECLICLNMISANSDQNSLHKQLLTKLEMYDFLKKNIDEAIKMLDDIKANGRDAIAKKSPIHSLVLSADEELQVEAGNLFRQGLRYVFSVEEEPRFPWGALVVFILGVVQIVGGALLTAFTFGTLAQVGMGLISEGISDCISAVESMVTGVFSWTSWAIEKAVSIGVSLIGFGIGKLISKGFKSCKSLKGFCKGLKAMPKFLSKQTKHGLSSVARTNMKNAVMHTVKKTAEELITFGLGKAEKKILTEILECIGNEVKEGIVDDVKSHLEKEELGSLVDIIILSHVENEEQLQDLLKDEDRKTKLLNIFTELSKTAIQPFVADLSMPNKLHSSILGVIDKAKAKVKGKARWILTAIKSVYMVSLAGEATAAVLSLSSKFFLNLQEQLRNFEKENDIPKDEKAKHLSASERVKEFKQQLADVISGLMADALVEVFHQKFSSYLVSLVQSEAHGVLSKYVRSGLKSDRTEELLRAGQNNNYIRHMPRDTDSKHHGEQSKSHAEKIKDHMTAGTILDIRVLSETTGTEVVILTENSRGKLTTMQKLSPNTNPANQKVTLIYRPKSDQHPDGHYDVLINNQTVRIESTGKGCLFHALARGMKPGASEAEIIKTADSLRIEEAEALLRHPGQWKPFVKRKEWTEAIRGGDWYMAEGAQPKKKITETRELYEKHVGKVELYKDLKKITKDNPGNGDFIHADHQPPVSCIVNAGKLNQNSKLANAMLEVGTNSSPLDTDLAKKMKGNRGRYLPAVYVPKEVHMDVPSTKAPYVRFELANAIKNDDIVGTFKLTILGSMPRFRLNSNQGFKDFNNTPMSKTRLSIYEDSFPHHSKKMVENWFNLLKDKGVMTKYHLNTINKWINTKGYNDQNDPHRNLVSSLLKNNKRRQDPMSEE